MWSHYTPPLPPPSPATPSSFRCRSSARRWGLVMTHKFIFLSTPLSITFVIAVFFFFFFCFAQFYIHRRASKNTKQAMVSSLPMSPLFLRIRLFSYLTTYLITYLFTFSYTLTQENMPCLSFSQNTSYLGKYLTTFSLRTWSLYTLTQTIARRNNTFDLSKFQSLYITFIRFSVTSAREHLHIFFLSFFLSFFLFKLPTAARYEIS